MSHLMKSRVYHVLIFLCFIGCCYHLIDLTIGYCKYDTASTYATYIPLTQLMPHTTLCIVADSKPNFHASYMNKKWPGDISYKFINEPVNTSSIINNCFLRNFTSGKLDETDCSSVFNTTVSTRANLYHCYTLSMMKSVNFSSIKIASTMGKKYFLYGFSLKQKFIQFDRIMAFVHFELWPYDDFYQYRDTEISLRENYWFLLPYDLFELISLPPPYATNCVHEHPSFCSSESRQDHPECSRVLCHKKLVVTYKYSLATKNKGIDVVVRSLSAPSEIVSHEARIQPSSYFITVSSILGFWCAVSIHLISSTSFNCMKKKFFSPSPSVISRWYAKVLEISERFGINLVRSAVQVKTDLSHNQQALESTGIQKTRFICKLIIVLLFCRELFFISNDYFQYKTGMEINFDYHSPLDIPSISHCFDIHEWLGTKKPKLHYLHFDEHMTRFSSKFNYTLTQVFDLVPHEKSVIESCRVRSSSLSPLKTIHKRCDEHFHVTKYYQNEFMCYLIELKMNFTIDPKANRTRDSHPGIMYSVIISDRAARVKHIQPIISYGLPRVSRLLAERFSWDEHHLAMLTFFSYEWQQKPYPYDTDCDTRNNHECEIDCLTSSRLEHLLYSEVYDERMNRSLMTYVDLKNHSTSQSVGQLEIKCKKLCKDPCAMKFVRTMVDRFSSNGKFEIAVSVPGYPAFHFTAVPVYYASDFLYQCMCCASFWLGVSFISLLNTLFKRDSDDRAPSRILFLMKLTQLITKQVEHKMKLKERPAQSYPSYFTSKINKLLYLAVLTFGFVIHCIATTGYYFEYPVRVDTRLLFEKNFTNLRMNFCFTIDQLHLGKSSSLEDVRSKSPNEENMILACGKRGSSLPDLSHLPSILQARIMPYVNSSSLCRSMFKVKKVITMGMVCYEVLPLANEGQRLFDVQHHIRDVNLDHYFTLQPSMSRFNLTIYISQHNSKASMIFSARSQADMSGKNIFNWVGHSKYLIKSPCYPYQMGRFNTFHQFRCVKNCINADTEAKFHLTSSQINHPTSSALKKERGNETFGSASIADECENKCIHSRSLRATDSAYFATFHDDIEGTQEGMKGLASTKTFKIYGSGYLVPHTTLYPMLRLVDFAIAIGSAFSFWFGLSAIQLVDRLLSPSTYQTQDEESDCASIIQQLNNLHQLSLHCAHHHHRRHQLDR